MPALILLIVLAAIIGFVVLAYNSLITDRNRADEAWADIDVQLKRRYNLIPNLVETVKGYAAHEEGVLTQVTEARSQAINAGNIQDQGKAENMLSGTLKSLFAVAENYPDLKANQNFLQLQSELVDTEDKIQSARRFYNGRVRDFNTKVQQFPVNFIANVFKFQAKEFFEVETAAEKQPVDVSFKKETPASPAPVPAAAPPLNPTSAPAAPVSSPESSPAVPAAPEAKPEVKPPSQPVPTAEKPADTPQDSPSGEAEPKTPSEDQKTGA